MTRLIPLLLLLFLGAAPASAAPPACKAWLNSQIRLLNSEQFLDLCAASQSHKALLFVNTASQCGYTPQFRQLEALYQRYREDGLLVVGFPSGDFRQEYSDESRTASVCFVNHGVTFPMAAPSAVTGPGANPVFKALAEQAEPPRWNFFKYLVDAQGRLAGHWVSSETPLDSDLEATVRALLSQ